MLCEQRKLCNLCKEEKCLSEFHKNARSKDGHANRCKDCIKLLKRYENPFDEIRKLKGSHIHKVLSSIKSLDGEYASGHELRLNYYPFLEDGSAELFEVDTSKYILKYGENEFNLSTKDASPYMKYVEVRVIVSREPATGKEWKYDINEIDETGLLHFIIKVDCEDLKIGDKVRFSNTSNSGRTYVNDAIALKFMDDTQTTYIHNVGYKLEPKKATPLVKRKNSSQGKLSHLKRGSTRKSNNKKFMVVGFIVAIYHFLAENYLLGLFILIICIGVFLVKKRERQKQSLNTRREPNNKFEVNRKFLPGYVTFDIETTGLDPENGDEIIEIAAVKVMHGKVVDTFTSFVKPTKKIPAKITKITGITNQDVSNQPSINKVLPKFHQFVGNNTLVAHNAPFDKKFLEFYSVSKVKNRTEDTLVIARNNLYFEKQNGTLNSFKLGEVARFLGYNIENAHRALDDALAVHFIYEKLIALQQPLE